ncbi:VanZ family protein [Zhongshania antarctica]|uniref:VanZ family protein n=1 Tax=Zhongshania antarctica TaxID=641702 RepID=A0A840R5B3_9GAMM|nr:VanZ family protein [Zhongshania antarctica]MBB5188385.1 VanZ family protein [Zhongshania antarctica]
MILSRKYRILLFLAYALVITVMSLLPAQQSPALGVWDKFQHFGAYLLFMMLAYPLASNHRWRIASSIGIIAYSIAVEYAQQLSPGRHTSYEDAFANSLGVISGYLLTWLLMHFTMRMSK